MRLWVPSSARSSASLLPFSFGPWRVVSAFSVRVDSVVVAMPGSCESSRALGGGGGRDLEEDGVSEHPKKTLTFGRTDSQVDYAVDGCLDDLEGPSG